MQTVYSNGIKNKQLWHQAREPEGDSGKAVLIMMAGHIWWNLMEKYLEYWQSCSVIKDWWSWGGYPNMGRKDWYGRYYLVSWSSWSFCCFRTNSTTLRENFCCQGPRRGGHWLSRTEPNCIITVQFGLVRNIKTKRFKNSKLFGLV